MCQRFSAVSLRVLYFGIFDFIKSIIFLLA